MDLALTEDEVAAILRALEAVEDLGEDEEAAMDKLLAMYAWHVAKEHLPEPVRKHPGPCNAVRMAAITQSIREAREAES